MAGTFDKPEVVQEELDILLIGGGMACCGTAYEIMRWAEAVKAETGKDLKIKLVDKAAMDRSGAVAQGLSAINTYIGDKQDPADYARMVSNDLMGITRDDLAYDVGRNVDDSVHLFEEWGLPIWKTDADGVRHDGAEAITEGLPALKDGGKPVRSGKWQIMINGESYKWIVAEAAKKALGLDRIQERVFIVNLINDKNDPSRIAGAVGFSVRENKIYIYKAKAVMLAAGGCVNLFRPRSVGEGHGPRLVPGVERRFDLRDGGGSRRRADHDGKPLRARPLQGRLRPGRRLVPAVQGQGHQRLRRRLHDQEQGHAERLPALWPGRRSRFLPAQPPDAEGNEGRSRPDLHGHRHRAGQAARDPVAEGSQAPRSRGLGRLPRHVYRPVRHLGRREHRAREEDVRTDADRALPARLALRLLRHLGVRPDRRRRADLGRVRRHPGPPAARLELGLPLA